MNRCSKCKKYICNCKDIQKDQSFLLPLEQIPDVYLETSFKCPDEIPTPVFASPNSSLSEAKLNELQLCIEEANNLLRSLGSQSDPENTRQLQLHLLKLQGIHVSVKINCKFEETKTSIVNGSKKKKTTKIIEKQLIDTVEEKSGVFCTAGRDFILLNTESGYLFILFDRLISLSRLSKSQNEDPSLQDVGRKVKKELVLNFGNFVSKKPELINLFFGIPLYMQLQKYIDKLIMVKTDTQIISGTLLFADENNIRIKNKQNVSTINIKDICFLEFCIIDEKSNNDSNLH